MSRAFVLVPPPLIVADCYFLCVFASPYPSAPSFGLTDHGNQTLELRAVEDTTLCDSDTAEDLSNARGDGLYVGVTGQGLRRRALLRFDMSLVEDPEDIVNVTLVLYERSNPRDEPATIAIHRLQQPWAEGNSFFPGGRCAPSSAMDASWNHSRYFILHHAHTHTHTYKRKQQKVASLFTSASCTSAWLAFACWQCSPFHPAPFALFPPAPAHRMNNRVGNFTRWQTPGGYFNTAASVAKDVGKDKEFYTWTSEAFRSNPNVRSVLVVCMMPVLLTAWRTSPLCLVASIFCVPSMPSCD